MLHFIDTGTDIQVVPHDPSGYLTELPVGIYEVSLTREMNPRFCLSKYEKALYTPDKLYGEVTENVETVKRRYLNRPESLGVLLTGAKGSGKTLIATLLSKAFIEMGKPVILVNSDWSERVNSLIPFLSVFKECLIIFDEFDKYYREEHQEHMLNFFDDKTKSHRLSLVIANKRHQLSEFFFDRPSRFFYEFYFDGMSQELLEDYLKDHQLEDMIPEFQYLRRNTKSFSFDVLQSLVDEMKLTGNKDLSKLLQHFNINTYAFEKNDGLEVVEIKGLPFDIALKSITLSDEILLFSHKGAHYEVVLHGSDIIDYDPRTKEFTYQVDHVYKDGSSDDMDLTVKIRQGAESTNFRFKSLALRARSEPSAKRTL